jgi:hypothetical protein
MTPTINPDHVAEWYDEIPDDGTIVKCRVSLVNDALNAMTPIYGPGMFALREPYGHNAQNETTYYWFKIRNNVGYAMVGSRREALDHFSRFPGA